MTEPIVDGTAPLIEGYAPHRVEERHEALSLFEVAPAPIAGSLELELDLPAIKAIACPTCNAAAGRDCRRPSGHRAMYGEPHRDRVHAATIAAANRTEHAPPIEPDDPALYPEWDS